MFNSRTEFISALNELQKDERNVFVMALIRHGITEQIIHGVNRSSAVTSLIRNISLTSLFTHVIKTAKCC